MSLKCKYANKQAEFFTLFGWRSWLWAAKDVPTVTIYFHLHISDHSWARFTWGNFCIVINVKSVKKRHIFSYLMWTQSQPDWRLIWNRGICWYVYMNVFFNTKQCCWVFYMMSSIICGSPPRKMTKEILECIIWTSLVQMPYDSE